MCSTCIPHAKSSGMCLAIAPPALYNSDMEHLLTSFETVMPLLIMMAVGMLLKKAKVVTKDVFLVINRIVYYVGLPCLIFNNLIKERNAQSDDWQVVALTLGGTLLLFILAWILLPHFIRDPKRRGAITQACIRSNDAIFSLTVAASMLGEGNFGLTIFTSAITATLYNLCSIFTLEMNRGGKMDLKSFCKNLLTNPVIISVVIGYLFQFTGWELPVVLQKPIVHFANMVPPLGFLALGGILSFRSVQKNRKALAFILVTKLIAIPLLLTGAAALLGFRGLRLLTVLLITAAPTAMSSYPLASALGSDAELAGEAVAITTACSLPTVFLFLTAFGGLL